VTWLLDSNVVSEWTKPNADARVRKWLLAVTERELFISVVTIAELRSGIDRLPMGERRRNLDTWLTNDIVFRFQGRVLGIDETIANICGQKLALANLSRDARSTMDVWIAAIATHHELTVVTRNVRDFEHLDVRIFNPWLEG
jgi:predicted nucleic acid-binding protein